MKNKQKDIKSYRGVIPTRYVFTKNNQVFINRNECDIASIIHEEEWFPVNFQWIPVFSFGKT